MQNLFFKLIIFVLTLFLYALQPKMFRCHLPYFPQPLVPYTLNAQCKAVVCAAFMVMIHQTHTGITSFNFACAPSATVGVL